MTAPPLTSPEVDSINWNLMDLGGVHLDDMDLDFAQLFDPTNEIVNMTPQADSSWDAAPESHASSGGVV